MSTIFTINFTPGFEELVSGIFESLDCEVIFSEEAFALVKFSSKPEPNSLRFAKSIIEVFDWGDDFESLKLSLPEGFEIPPVRTFTIRSLESGRPSKLDSRKRVDLIKEISVKTGLAYSSFEPDVDFVIAKRRDGKSYFGFKLPLDKESKPQRGELGLDVTNLLIRLGDMSDRKRVLDAFSGYGGVTRELLKSFKPESVELVEKDSRMVNLLKALFKDESSARVVAGDVVSFLKRPGENLDLIIADPPWGEFKEYKGDLGRLYLDFLTAAKPRLSEKGKLVIMSSKKEELEDAAKKSGLSIESRLNVLISGKKVLVLKLG